MHARVQDSRRLYWATDEDNAKYRTVQSITAIERQGHARAGAFSRLHCLLALAVHTHACMRAHMYTHVHTHVRTHVHTDALAHRLLCILRVKPTDPPPAAGTCEFWFDQTHAREFFTFRWVGGAGWGKGVRVQEPAASW